MTVTQIPIHDTTVHVDLTDTVVDYETCVCLHLYLPVSCFGHSFS